MNEDNRNTNYNNNGNDNKKVNNIGEKVPTTGITELKEFYLEYTYVDKTLLTMKLFMIGTETIYSSCWVALFKPSQWGKTAFMSMLEAIAGGQGNKEMFENLVIRGPGVTYDWKKYKVIRLSMSPVIKNISTDKNNPNFKKIFI